MAYTFTVTYSMFLYEIFRSLLLKEFNIPTFWEAVQDEREHTCEDFLLLNTPEHKMAAGLHPERGSDSTYGRIYWTGRSPWSKYKTTTQSEAGIKMKLLREQINIYFIWQCKRAPPSKNEKRCLALPR